jgi:hypothetical protein
MPTTPTSDAVSPGTAGYLRMTSPVLTTTGTEQPETATTVKEMGCSHGQRGSSQAWTLPEETRGGMRARLFVDSLKGMWSRSPMNEVSEAVNVAYNALKRLDLSLFHVINGWCGTSVLDYAAWFAQGNNFFKGGIVMAAYWWFWFTPGERDDCRRKIVSALLGMISSLVIARALASSLPFRVRPLYAAGIDYRPHSPPGLHEVSGLNLEDWSSFPSDHAAVFFCVGIWFVVSISPNRYFDHAFCRDLGKLSPRLSRDSLSIGGDRWWCNRGNLRLYHRANGQPKNIRSHFTV